MDWVPICVRNYKNCKTEQLAKGYSASELWDKLKSASWNFEMGQAFIKKKKAESYNDV